MDIKVKQVSSLEKVYMQEIEELNDIKRSTAMRGEVFSYQIAISSSNNAEFEVEIESPLKDNIKLYAVKKVPMDLATYTDIDKYKPADDDYITNAPGLMPDVLMPLESENNMIRLANDSASLWVSVKVPEDADLGEIPIVIKLSCYDDWDKFGMSAIRTMTLNVISAVMPEHKTMFTQWFHVDCIADAHNVPIYSEEHWELIDKYMALAAKLGINMILTPIVTPPLDTKVGIRRPCTQLVKIEKINSKYTFDFSLLKRWIALADKNKIKYLEMAHLFSQWGLKYSPNIKVTENGREDYMFGWHTDAQSSKYKQFLDSFLPALIEFLKTEGVKDRCYFHISDEPSLEHLSAYKYALDIVKPLIDGCPSMDAISNYGFYEKGLITTPVTASNHIDEFLENNVENQWVYYCCSQYNKVGNRFLAMPSYRNRILGLQMYKFNIQGFLHWGYNFYYNQYSRRKINPYITTSSDKGFPSGDPFSVYPTMGGVVPSLRAVVFREALYDVEICRMLEGFIGREQVIKMIDDAADMDITFSEYPRNSEFIPTLIENMKKEIEAHIKKQ